MERNFAYKVSGGVLTYVMPQELDHHVAKDLCRELDMLIESYQIKELVLDFAQTEFMDSSGIGVIIGRSKTMHFHRGVIVATNLGKRVKTIFESAGLYRIIRIKED